MSISGTLGSQIQWLAGLAWCPYSSRNWYQIEGSCDMLLWIRTLKNISLEKAIGSTSECQPFWHSRFYSKDHGLVVRWLLRSAGAAKNVTSLEYVRMLKWCPNFLCDTCIINGQSIIYVLNIQIKILIFMQENVWSGPWTKLEVDVLGICFHLKPFSH